MTTLRSDTQTVTIAAPRDGVLAFLADGANLPRWAIGFAKEARPDGAGRWVVTTGQGAEVAIEVRSDEEAGTADFHMSPAQGVEAVAYCRVVANGDGSEVVFTQLQVPGMPDEAFEGQVEAVAHELVALKAVLEVSCPN